MEKYKKIEKKYWKASGLYVLAMLGGTGFVIMPWYQPVGIIFYFVVILGAGDHPDTYRYHRNSLGR